MMNLKGFGSSGRGLILRYSTSIRLEALTKTTKKVSQYRRSSGRDVNTGPPKYDAVVLGKITLN